MSNQKVILHSKEKDHKLLRELREALSKKGFRDDYRWNDRISIDLHRYDSVFIGDVGEGGINDVTLLNKRDMLDGNEYQIIPVSRNDFQTMFLLY